MGETRNAVEDIGGKTRRKETTRKTKKYAGGFIKMDV
jgi:hypothetical protein